MTVSKRTVKGKKLWVIDRRFRTEQGEERFRRVAQVQTRQAAEAEERRIEKYFADHGTIMPLLGAMPKVDESEQPKDAATWEEAVTYYKEHALPILEASTRRGYTVLLEGPHIQHWKGVPLGEITRAKIVSWDAAMRQTGVSASTRRNHQIVLRSVLKSVGPHDDEKGVLLETLPGFPPLPKVGTTEVQDVSREDIGQLLGARPKGFQVKTWTLFGLAVSLGAHAGLRASEIRALRRKDVDLESRIITVRLKRCAGEEGPPKSKHQRSIDFIAPELLTRLEEHCRSLGPEDYVCPSSSGMPWSDNGLWAAFRRTCVALKIEGQRLHGLRHAFATALFGGGVDARTVQELLGHSSLNVTMRYAHTSRERKRAAGQVFEERAAE